MHALRSLAAAGLALAAPAAAAQAFGTLTQDDPAAVLDVAALATGGAVVAAPTLDSPLFANPAHLAGTRRLRITLLGAGGDAGGNVRETYSFVQDELRPALDEGLEEIRQSDPDRLQALYDEAFRIGRSQKTAGVTAFAPSVIVPAGPVTVGAGGFATSTARARIGDAGAGIPFIDTYAQADALVPVGVGYRVVGLPFGLDVGATATYVLRHVTAKADPIDAFDADSEKAYLLRGAGVRVGVGAMARDVGVRGLDAGIALTNIGGAVPLTFDRSVSLMGSESDPDDDDEIARLEARFAERAPAAEVRVGAAFRAPTALVPGLSDALVTADFTTRSTSEFEQSAQAGLRLGARATLGGALALRVGVSQGMPSAGVGVQSRLARFEIATYGVEDGRLLGQQRRRNVVAQLRLGWF